MWIAGNAVSDGEINCDRFCTFDDGSRNRLIYSSLNLVLRGSDQIMLGACKLHQHKAVGVFKCEVEVTFILELIWRPDLEAVRPINSDPPPSIASEKAL